MRGCRNPVLDADLTLPYLKMWFICIYVRFKFESVSKARSGIIIYSTLNIQIYDEISIPLIPVLSQIMIFGSTGMSKRKN